MQRRSVQDIIPQEVQCLFPFDYFNDMQAQLVSQLLGSDKNVVVAAPTGSGKTVILELALARLILSNKTLRCVYIAPSKALCQQRWTEWKLKLEPLKMQVLEVTGDVDWKEVMKTISTAAIIVTTPEKWDALTRMWRDNIFLLGLIDLLMLDEIHHLGEDRGAILETVVVRLRMINRHSLLEDTNSSQRRSVVDRMRIVALSATLPNIGDVGKWLECEEDCIHFFDDSFRPVPLRVLCFGYECRGNQYLFEKSLDRHLKDLIKTYSSGRQTLVFCASKKGTQSCAAFLKQNQILSSWQGAADSLIKYSCEQLQDKALAELIPFGVAYHHAGLPPDDRMIIEQLFLQNRIRVLCSTSTLAHGMNLPAYLVIVKGTFAWRGSGRGYEHLKRSDVIQMLGRAGRLGYDSEGIAIIMTSAQDQHIYSSMSLQADVVESKLTLVVHEGYYAIPLQVSLIRIRLRHTALENLKEAKLVGYVKGEILEDPTVEPLPEAHIMSKALIKFGSMKLLTSLTADMQLHQLIKAFSACEELHKPVRRSEKKTLNDLMKFVRFPLRERVQDPSHKSYVLMQAAVNATEIKDFTLRIEQADIVENATRLLKGLQELCVHRQLGFLLEATILFERALRTRLWEGLNSCQFFQCGGLSAKTMKALQANGINSVTDIYGLSLAQVQQRVDCSPNEAKVILQFAASVHRSRLVASLKAMGEQKVIISIELAEKGNEIMGLQPMPFQLLCYDTISAKLICFRRLPLGCNGTEISVKLPDGQTDTTKLRCRILGSLVGADYSCGAPINEEVTSKRKRISGTEPTVPQAKKTKPIQKLHDSLDSSSKVKDRREDKMISVAKDSNFQSQPKPLVGGNQKDRYFEMFRCPETPKKLLNHPPPSSCSIESSMLNKYKAEAESFSQRVADIRVPSLSVFKPRTAQIMQEIGLVANPITGSREQMISPDNRSDFISGSQIKNENLIIHPLRVLTSSSQDGTKASRFFDSVASTNSMNPIEVKSCSLGKGVSTLLQSVYKAKSSASDRIYSSKIDSTSNISQSDPIAEDFAAAFG
eukprot:scaffold398_cov177-Ochromonas_danica.AAC.30